jgi:hypothetical protein
MSDEAKKYDLGKAVVKIGDQVVGTFDNVKVAESIQPISVGTTDVSLSGFGDGVNISGTGINGIFTGTNIMGFPYPPPPQPELEKENLDIDPVQLEAYVKDYFENYFNKDGAQMPKPPEKVISEMKIPGTKEISKRTIKIKGEEK